MTRKVFINNAKTAGFVPKTNKDLKKEAKAAEKEAKKSK
jgi:hypothetical protein